MKKKFAIIILALFSFFFSSSMIKAESLSVVLSKKEKTITVGEQFFVRMKLSSLVNYRSMEAFLAYDEEMVSYISADDGITGGGGKLKINIENLLSADEVEEFVEDYGVVEDHSEAEENKRTFQMVFKALKSGKTNFHFVDGIKIFSENDEEMSVSSNSLDFVIQEKREESDVNTLSELKIEDANLKPEFKKNIYQYTLEVSSETKKLRLNALPTDDKANVIVAGNDNFQVGENLVKIIVTAENGSETVYEIIVTRKEESSESALEKEGQKNETEPISKVIIGESDEKESELPVEKKESEKADRKKLIFYVIMGSVGFITFILLKFLLKMIDKMEKGEENKGAKFHKPTIKNEDKEENK